jgi:hypothetical protein
MSIFARVFGLLRGPAATHVADDAAAATERPLLFKTTEVQRQIDTKVAQARTHLGAARNAFAHDEAELTGIEGAVKDARGQIQARPGADSIDESWYRVDGLQADPRLPKSTRDALSELGGRVTQMYDRLPHGAAAGHLEEAQTLLKDARDTAGDARDPSLDTSKIDDALAEHRRLNTVMSDLDIRGRRAHADIFGDHAAWDVKRPDGTVIHRPARVDNPPSD